MKQCKVKGSIKLKTTIMKNVIKNGDIVYSTGVFLMRDTNVNGGWIVTEFENDTFYDGKIVNSKECDDINSVEYFIE